MYLNCHSYHSLRYGTIPLKELVQQAAMCNVKAMALTDIHTVTGIYDFIKECEAVAIKPLIGIEFRNKNKLLYVGLAKNAVGLAEMNRFLTKHNFEGTPLPEQASNFEHVIVIYPLENAPPVLKDYEYIGIPPEKLPILFSQQWKIRMDKMVVFQPVTFRTKKEFNLHKILRAIDTNIILSKLTEEDYCKTSEVMIPLEELLDKFKEYPQIIGNTQKIIEACNFEFDFKTPKNKKYYTNTKKDDIALLTNLSKQGLIWRYGKNNAAAMAQIEKELKVIDELEFSGYFLITWDIIRYSNSQGFMHIGRGS
ncbi:PHP domain-containing protein, partial [Flavobacterium sp.]|uniref:PHP domain-containing protein n=1 Tax=Flavobacterium sp. TaxID=239 RepID=UPI002B4AD702